MTAHTTGQLHSQSWDLPLVQFQTENSSFPTTSVPLLKSIFNISSTKLKLWFCLIAWTWSKTDPILPVVFHVLFSWRKCHSDITKQNKKQLMKQQTKCSQGFIWYRSSFHSASRNEHSGKEENQSEWQMAQAQALQLLCSQGGSSGNSPEQKESRCQIQQLLTPSKEVREMVPGSLFSPGTAAPTAYSCSTAWNVNHNLRIAHLGLYISWWPPNPRGSQHSLDLTEIGDFSGRGKNYLMWRKSL